MAEDIIHYLRYSLSSPSSSHRHPSLFSHNFSRVKLGLVVGGDEVAFPSHILLRHS